MNCNGCIWLDQAVNGKAGDGYCIRVILSKDYDAELERKLVSIEKMKLYSKKVRTAEKERCELYEEGDFSKRYENAAK